MRRLLLYIKRFFVAIMQALLVAVKWVYHIIKKLVTKLIHFWIHLAHRFKAAKNPLRRDDEVTVVEARTINRRNFISFATFTGLYVAGYGAWRWLYTSPHETAGITAGAHKTLRRALNKTELAFRETFSDNHLVQTYSKSRAAKNVRVNSNIGITNSRYNIDKWMLTINKHDGSTLQVSMDDIKKIPKTDIVFDFKCVEGWDQIQHWGGVSFRDFISYFYLQDQAKMKYVGMATPGEAGYYVGLDMPSAMHPQTILAYELNEQVLPLNHGYPLRLIVPVKYGIKNLKRIGSISFSNSRPPDYWAEQGYDYYSGL